MVQRRKQEALAWDNGTSRRASGWAGEKVAQWKINQPPPPSLPYSYDDGPDLP